MRSLLNKIFASKLGLGKFILAGIAFLIGLTLVLVSVQMYFKVQEFLNPKQNLSGFILLNKEVGIGNTIFGSKAEFTNEEITELQSQDFVEDLGKFNSSNYRAVLDLSGKLGLGEGMSLDLSFESVPDRFIDEKPYNFKWSEGDDFLPIIATQELLNLYNFSFALGRGLPQLSKSTIGLIPLEIELSGPGGRKTFQGKIVGFSDRIPSVLVPEEFMTWTNKNIAQAQNKNTSRVIVKINGSQASHLVPYLQEHDLKVSEDKLKLSKVSSLVTIAISVLFIIGSSFLLFALVIVIMNFSLILAEAKEEVKLLLQLGYKKRTISYHLIFYLSVFVFSVSICSFLLFYLLNSLFTNFLEKNGISMSNTIEPSVILTGLLFISMAYFLSVLYINKMLKKNN